MGLWSSTKLAIHELAERAGLHVSYVAPATSDAACLAALLELHQVDLILDVGANVGQYAQGVLKNGYRGRIVSFEPLSGPHTALLEASREIPKWEIAAPICLGDQEGEVDVNVSENSISSSILPLTEVHLRTSPDARFISYERVPITRLDTIADRYLSGSNAPFLKIDVQGFEQQVLDGGPETLKKLQGIQVELSLLAVYEGQTLMTEQLVFLEQLGFALYRFFPSFMDVKTGRWLQADGLFFRTQRASVTGDALGHQ